jgi:hypothetical protein
MYASWFRNRLALLSEYAASLALSLPFGLAYLYLQSVGLSTRVAFALAVVPSITLSYFVAEAIHKAQQRKPALEKRVIERVVMTTAPNVFALEVIQFAAVASGVAFAVFVAPPAPTPTNTTRCHAIVCQQPPNSEADFNGSPFIRP